MSLILSLEAWAFCSGSLLAIALGSFQAVQDPPIFAEAPAQAPAEARATLSPAAIEYLTFQEPIITEENMETVLQQRRERLAAVRIKLRQEALQYKGIKVRSEPGVQNVAAIEGAFVGQDPLPPERLQYFNRYLTKRDRIIHVGWHGVFLKETQDDQGSLVEVKIKPVFVSARGGFGMITDHCIETWRYEAGGKLTFVKLVPGAKKPGRGLILY
ncbi:MAG: hypothetical protein WD278_17510 [Pirellulales bacterium]